MDVLKVHARINEVTGKDIPITDMYTYPTIRALSTYLASKTTSRPQEENLKENILQRADAIGAARKNRPQPRNRRVQ